jgi:hypothetical protein
MILAAAMGLMIVLAFAALLIFVFSPKKREGSSK